MSKLKKQIFKYKGEDIIAGGKLVDQQIDEFYSNNPNCRVMSITDERKIAVESETEKLCNITVILEYQEKAEDDGTD